MRIGEAAKRLDVTTATIRNYIKKGILECEKTPSGQVRITEQQLAKLIGDDNIEDDRAIAFYIRSSRGSQQELDSQCTKLETVYGTSHLTYADKSSGLNEQRKGLWRLIKDCKKEKIKTIAITNKDRLSRFGYKYLEEIFNILDVKIEILDETENKSDIYDELLRDFMSLIASFSGKFYRVRGYKQQRQLLDTANKEIDKKEQEHVDETE